MGQQDHRGRAAYLKERNRVWMLMRTTPLRCAMSAVLAYAWGAVRECGSALRAMEPGRVWVQARVMLAAVAYLPRALRSRWVQRRAGMVSRRYWTLVRRDILFFEGLPSSKEKGS